MRRLMFWIVSLLAFTPALGAADLPKEKPKEKPKTEKPAPAAEQLQAILKEIQAIADDADKAFREAKTQAEKQKIREGFLKKIQDFAPRFLQLAEKNPTEDAALQAVGIVLNVAPGTPHHDKALVVLRMLAEKQAKKEARVQATFLLAQQLKMKSEAPNAKKADADKLTKDAEELFARIEEKYADVNKDITEQAKTELFELRNLAIGKTPPDIEAEDADGKKFKLSDYRGKVVVLDFWAEW